MNTDRHIWEGWHVSDFIEALEVEFDRIVSNSRYFSLRKPFNDEKELKAWVKDNQPYYKKHIPEVYAHFRKKWKSLK